MHRTGTILVICLFIFIGFPRILIQEANANDIKLKKNEEVNVTLEIIEIKPIASELTVENVTINENGNETITSKNETIQAQITDEKLENPLNKVANSNITENGTAVEETMFIEHVIIPELATNISKNSSNQEALIKKLKLEIEEANNDLFNKTERFKELKIKAEKAQNLSDIASHHLNILIDAMTNLQQSIIHSSKAAFETDWQLQLQTAMYNDAKRKHVRLTDELARSKVDYERTKAAVEAAKIAAKIAQKNVNRDDENMLKLVSTGANRLFVSQLESAL